MKIHERMSEKRYFYMIVFLAVILFVLSGCEKQQPESESADSIPTINIGISARTGLSKNLSEVNQTLGDLTEEKIGVRARLVWTGLNSSQGNSYYKNRQLGVDILNISFNQFENYRQKNLLLNMEPYMAEVLALQEVLDEKTDLPEDEREGVYGIPKPLSDIHTNGVILNRTYVEKYHMDISNIHKPEDLEPLLDIIKKERPDVVPWALEKRGNAVVERSPIADILDGCLAGILYEGTDDTVCNIYESDAYTKRVELAKRWQEKGYLAKDVITNIEAGQTQVIAGDAFAAEFVIKPDEMQYEESLYGDKVIIIPFDNRPVLDTEDDWVTVWSIFSETKYPEEAVKVLGLLYSDEDVLNTILYGVEGMHYEVQEDGSFAFPSGINSSNVGYFCSTKWQFNTPKAGIWSGMSDDLEGDFKTFIASANISPAYGFWLDESRITVDIQKLKEIVSRYKKNLNIGLGADGKDVDTYLEEFRKELREAGSEELVKEVRDQYQAWKTKKEYDVGVKSPQL